MSKLIKLKNNIGKGLLKLILITSIFLVNLFNNNVIVKADDTETLEISFTSSVDLNENISQLVIVVMEHEGQSYESDGNVETEEPFQYFSETYDSTYLYFDASPVTSFEKNKTYTFRLKGLNKNQEYRVVVTPSENDMSTIDYLCPGGNVKKSVAIYPKNNSIACKIHDSSNTDAVEDASMINKINIKLEQAPAVQYKLPLKVESEHLKGALASMCLNNGAVLDTTVLQYATDLEHLLNDDKTSIYQDKHSISFSDSNKKQDGKPIIEYMGDNVEHRSENFTDIFTSQSTTTVPIGLDKIKPGEINTFYVRNVVDRYVSTRNPLYWKVDLDIGEDFKLNSYNITQIRYENGDVINKPVDSIEIYNYDERFAQLAVKCYAASNPEDVFKYEILIKTSNPSQNVFTARMDAPNAEETTFNANETFSIELKHREAIIIDGVPIGSTYTIKQEKKNNYTTTVATEFNSKENIALDLNEDNTHYIAENLKLELDTIYEKVEEFSNGNQANEPCPPPLQAGTIPINFGIYWSNRTEDDMKIRLQKRTAFPFNGIKDYLAESTLEGAEFTLVGSDGSEIVKQTDKNGLVEFTGLDESHSYIVWESKAPNGYYKNDGRIYTHQGYGVIGNKWKNSIIKSRFKNEQVTEFGLIKDDNGIYYADIYEEVSLVLLQVVKYGLLDNDQYKDPLVQLKHFAFIYENDDPEQAEYEEFFGPKDYFESLEGVEFEMTLDSHPNDPRYTFHAITDEYGGAVFTRQFPLDEIEQYYNFNEFAVYYGKYTIREINTPEGYRPMEDLHIEIKAPEEGRVLSSPNTESLFSVLRVVNEKKTGDLTISKEIKGGNIDKNKEFKFTINLKDKDNNPLTTEFKYEGSKKGTIKNGDTITLKHNESITIKYLPENTKYEIVEEQVTGYTTSVNGKASNNIKGTIVDNKKEIVKYVNTSNPKNEYRIPKTGD